MDLNNDLIMQFAKIAKIDTKNKDATTVRGTVHISDGRNYIQLDGATENSLTPAESTVEVSEGDRVIAAVKDHSIVITGNKTNPSIGTVTAGNLRSTIEQTASAITTRVENLEGNDAKFSEFKQTVEGFSFMHEDGSGVKISHGDINLTGAITWSDLDSSTKSTINSVADDAEEAAANAQSKADSAYDLADTANTAAGNAQSKADSAYAIAKNAMTEAETNALPSYIKSTYIDATRIESPTITGGTFHAVGTDPNSKSTFSIMNEDGFHLYSYATVADIDGAVYPKISLYCNNDANASPEIILGSGESDNSSMANRLVIHKGSTGSSIHHYGSGTQDGSGIGFGINGTVEVDGELRGSTGLFPIGYIYLTYDDTHPAQLFGGTWVQLKAVFLYATGDLTAIGTEGTIVNDHLYAEGVSRAYFVKIAAWRRIS